MDIEKLAERCMVAESCLPDAPYRTQLCKLHQEMLDEIARLRAEVEDAKGETAWLRNRINEIQRKTEIDLVNIYDALESASLDDTITDTIWMLHKVSASQTLFDYIDAAIDAARGGK